jgi:hypothetical protein
VADFASMKASLAADQNPPSSKLAVLDGSHGLKVKDEELEEGEIEETLGDYDFVPSLRLKYSIMVSLSSSCHVRSQVPGASLSGTDPALRN